MSHDADRLATQLAFAEAGPDTRWRDAAHLGIELIDHPDSRDHPIFHLAADGDVVYYNQRNREWATVEQARNGTRVQSGTLRRVHHPGISRDASVHPTAYVDPAARVETGAVIGPHARVWRDAHIGRDTHIGAGAHIGPGAYIGADTLVHHGCAIGSGSVIGTGSDLGQNTRIGAGAHIGQHSRLAPYSTVGAGHTNSHAAGRLVAHGAHLAEKLATLNRSD